ncbi:glycosyl hydrolases family 2, TIM barrel domain-containing protein [Mycena floridula]|nr:glycosyl hydrolases family 2, TIM barrel domain-containing protein [Mycena floridula]
MKFPQAQPDWASLKCLHRSTLEPRAHFKVKDTVSLSGTWHFELLPNPYAEPVQSGYITVPGMWQLQGYGLPPQYVNTVFPFPVDPPNVSFSVNECGIYSRKFTVPDSFSAGKQIRLRLGGVDSAFHVILNDKEIGFHTGARNTSEFDLTSDLIDGENSLSIKVYKYSFGSYIERQDQWSLSGIFRDVFLVAFPAVTRIEDFFVQTDFVDSSYTDANLKVSVTLSAETEVALSLVDAEGKLVVESTTTKGLFELPISGPNKWTAETPYLYNLTLTIPEQSIECKIGFRSTCLDLETNTFLANGVPIKFRGVNRHEHHPETGRAVPYEFMRDDLLLMKRYNINAIRTSHQLNDERMLDLADELGFWVVAEADLEAHGFADVEEHALKTKMEATLDVDPHNATTGSISSNQEILDLSPKERQNHIYDRAASWTTDNPDWEEAYVDRTKQLVVRDKNHPSVVLWSMGNEAFWGRNFKKMYEYIKSVDPTRLVHYEADRAGECVDILSQMYSSVALIREYASHPNDPFPDKKPLANKRKPLLLCEFAHAMGNGPGGLAEYVDAFYEFPLLMGGLVWEWANHGLLAVRTTDDKVVTEVGGRIKGRVPTTAEREEFKNKPSDKFFYAYGGDFGEGPHDSNFVMDGLLRSNHTAGRGLEEYKRVISGVRVLSKTVALKDGNVAIEIINRYDILTLEHLACTATLLIDGVASGDQSLITIPENISPHTKSWLTVPVPDSVAKAAGEVTVTLSFTLKEATQWAERGHEIAWGQTTIETSSPTTTISTSRKLKIIKPTLHTLRIRSSGSEWTFDTAQGQLVSWIKGPESPSNDYVQISGTDMSTSAAASGHELLVRTTMDFYRPQTDNDRLGADGADWVEKRVHQTQVHFLGSEWEDIGETAEFTITVKSRIAPPVLDWSVNTVTKYTFNSSGRLTISTVGKPQGKTLPRTWGRVGMTFELNTSSTSLDSVQWYGLGPVEAYPDKVLAARLGIWNTSINAISKEWEKQYEYPQEGAARAGVRWVSLGDGNTGIKASFPAKSPGYFTVSQYPFSAVDAATHPFDLYPYRLENSVLLRLDSAMHGVGTASCGPGVLEDYKLLASKDVFWEVRLE